MVTPLPDIIIHDRTKDDKFIVVGCDGVWDVMTNEEVCEFVSQDLVLFFYFSRYMKKT